MENNVYAKKSKRKRLAWTEDGEVAFLNLWAEHATDLRNSRKNGHIYTEMANELAKLGYNYSARDVQVKLANFTQRYRKMKMGMGPSGGSQTSWPFYGRVHQIIGGFKVKTFSELTVESNDEFANASQPSLSTASSSPLPSPLSPLLTTPLPSPSSPLLSPLSPILRTLASASEAKQIKRMGNFQKRIFEKLEILSSEISDHIKSSEENRKQLMRIEQEKADIMKEIAKDNKELKNAILLFLKKDK